MSFVNDSNYQITVYPGQDVSNNTFYPSIHQDYGWVDFNQNRYTYGCLQVLPMTNDAMKAALEKEGYKVLTPAEFKAEKLERVRHVLDNASINSETQLAIMEAITEVLR